ncbi:MAG: YqcC family protein [Marinagarivorans sp.]|nr:YqcC family protein [Marinagarivorans sp.]
MIPDRQFIAHLLHSLVLELKRLGEWQATPPSPAQLASQWPFCVDTLTFYQWLQWVFVIKIQGWAQSTKRHTPGCAHIACTLGRFANSIGGQPRIIMAAGRQPDAGGSSNNVDSITVHMV